MKGILTRKDFLAYLAMGGSVGFDKPIKLNRSQLQKLTKDQLMGRDVIKIDGKSGYLDGKGYWTPESKLNKSINK